MPISYLPLDRIEAEAEAKKSPSHQAGAFIFNPNERNGITAIRSIL
jgi:hypothetical protein